MATNYGASISRDGLKILLDAGNVKSYPGTGTTWYDTSGNGNDFTINASAYKNTGPKYMDFNGSYGCGLTASGVNTPNYGSTCTAIVWTRIKNSTSDWRTLFRAEGTGADHQVIVIVNDWTIGMYDNTNGSGFNGSGFSQQSLPGYASNAWNMLVWRWQSTQTNYYYYNFSYNNTPGTLRGYNSSANARFKTGFRTLGAYNSGSPSQFWGDIGYLAMYDRYIGDEEVLNHFYAQRGRFGI